MSRLPQAEITAIYELPVPIWVSCAALGQSYSAGMGGLRFEVVMPRDKGPVGGAPVVDGVVLPGHQYTGEPVEWTTRYAGDVPEEFEPATALRHIAITAVQVPQDPQNKRPQQLLAQCVGVWFDRVRTWAEIRTGQDLDPSHRLYDAETVGAGLSFAPGSRVSGIRLTVKQIRPISAEEWSKALSDVRDAVEPPVAYLLHRDARAAQHRGLYRRAVIDAAASVEIPLHGILEARSGELPESQRKRLKDRPSLGILIAIAQESKLSLGVPFEDLKQLIRVRNDAVHRAQAPGYLETHQLVSTASDFLSANPDF